MMKFIFGMQINIEVFYKLILSIWVCVTRHVQSTQKLLFFPTNKQESFLQTDSITLGV